MRKNHKNYLPVLALIGLLLASLLSACGDDKTPHFKSVELSQDYSQGEAVGVTNSFKTTDKAIHVVIQMAGDFYGSDVKLNWLKVDPADATKTTQVSQNDIPMHKELEIYDVTYRPAEGTTFLPGKYKTEVYLNDKLDRTLEFTIQ